MPKISTGLDNQTWVDIEEIINVVFHSTDIIIHVYDLGGKF